MSMSETEFQIVETLEGATDDTDLDQFSSDFFGEKKEEAAPAKAAADEDKDDDAPKDDTHAEDDTLADEDDKDGKQDEPEPKPKSRSEKRIEELNAKYRQEQREKQELLTRLEALEKAQKNPEPKSAPVKEAGGPEPDDVKEDGTEKYPLGEFDPGYIRDLTRYTIAQEREASKAELQREAEQNKVSEAQNALVAEWNTRLPAAQEKYEDFNEKGQELIESFDGIDPAYGSYLTETLMSMEFGPDVLYHLATHPDEAAEIVNSGARLATIKLGRLESKFAGGKEVEQRRVSNAPTPPPINKGSAPARVTVADDTDDLAAFEKKFFKR